MEDYSTLGIWGVILGLGFGSFALRYSFLGLVGRRSLPAWALRYLRYTAVAVLPALVTPLIAWPQATGGHTDPARLLAAAATVAVGLWRRDALTAIFAGFVALYLALWLIG